MNKTKRASNSRNKSYRVIAEEKSVGFLIVEAGSEKQAIKKAKEFPAWCFHSMGRSFNLVGIREITGREDLKIKYFAEPIPHSPTANEECE